MRDRSGRPAPARAGDTRAQSRRLIATPTVLLWTDAPGPYVRAADAKGLAARVELITVPLAEDPGDDVLGRCEALLAWRPPPRLAARAPRLRWIQSLTAGVEHWLASPDLPAGAVITCARGTHRLQMPEHILAALFLVTKHLDGIVLDQRERRWRRRVNDTLAGKTLGILGLGAIGAELAKKAVALEMRVIGTRRDGAPVPHVERVWRPDGTNEVLDAADYVLLLLPSTVETRGLMDKERLARMRPTAYLLNFGRGDLVVDADLVEAVRTRRIAGAVLDVFTTEPLPDDSPLWVTDGIVIFPHVGGLHPQRDALVAELFADNLRRFVAGEPLRETVDRARGY
ncbi:MAG: D-2-hydroxyacid dehydrogenase [Candidatus Rokubacteria bacterium]|nr:D-2-hydroxyacid dehydrogenase [Candidatus Rokubacteria bacterium]